MTKKMTSVILGAMLLVGIGVTAEEKQQETRDWLKADPQAISDWQDMRFGMFIHWGPVSLTGREIGWSRGAQTPVEEYDQLYKRFNPEQFDANAWVKAAKDAGMKYVVLTTKHHDGFCLWPSKLTDYNIAETPFKRDVVKELSEACRKQDIKFGAYYSVCDWYNPDFPVTSPGGKTQREVSNLDRYVEYLRGQVTELIKNYGPLNTIWFDVPQKVTREQAEKTVTMLRQMQPDILVNSRAGGGFKGDYDTPEQQIGGFNRTRPWETCMTICNQWAWKPNDSMKSLKECIQTLLYTVGGDGNLLFNVGPTPEGVIEERQVERLKEMGAWLADYGACVYKTHGGPFKPGKWGASTCIGHKIYLFVMNWSEDSLMLPSVGVKVKKAKALSGGQVEITQKDEGIRLKMSKEDQKDIATVIELEVEGDATAIQSVDVI